MSDLPYNTMCSDLHLLPLELRRNVADVLFLLDILNNRIDCPELLSKFGLRAPVFSSRHHSLLHVPHANTNVRQNAYVLRVCTYFNGLSDNDCIDLFNTSASVVRSLLIKNNFKCE